MTELNLQSPGLLGGTAQEKVIILGAAVASLLLHALLFVVFWLVPWQPQRADRVVQDTSRDVELILTPAPEDVAAEAERPTTYVSVPERQAVEEAPADPDYLALHHSLAADNKLGDSDRPSADEESEFEMVEIRKEDLRGAGGVEYSPQPLPENEPSTSRRATGAEGEDQTAAQGDDQKPLGEWALPEDKTRSGDETVGDRDDKLNEDSPELEQWWGGRSHPSILKQGREGSPGDRGFDFNQQASGALTSGVAVIDDLRLNTVQWDWAPWIQVFGNELHRHWVSPYAYQLGLLDGTTVIRLVVERDGRPSSMEVLEKDGHQSLHDASLAALKAFAPYLPLPAHFPEENLVITLSLHYPAFRR